MCLEENSVPHRQDTGRQSGSGLVLPESLSPSQTMWRQLLEDSDDAGGETVPELVGASFCDCSRGHHIEVLHLLIRVLYP